MSPMKRSKGASMRFTWRSRARATCWTLFLQNNAESLVALARKEENAGLKKQIVEKLSLMKSKIATDYLLELLNK